MSTVRVFSLLALVVIPLAFSSADAAQSSASFRYVTSRSWEVGDAFTGVLGLPGASGGAGCVGQSAPAECAFKLGAGFRGSVELAFRDTVFSAIAVSWTFLNDAGDVCLAGSGTNGFVAEAPEGCAWLALRIEDPATAGSGTLTFAS